MGYGGPLKSDILKWIACGLLNDVIGSESGLPNDVIGSESPPLESSVSPRLYLRGERSKINP